MECYPTMTEKLNSMGKYEKCYPTKTRKLNKMGKDEATRNDANCCRQAQSPKDPTGQVASQDEASQTILHPVAL